jgi:hypothetical protein
VTIPEVDDSKWMQESMGNFHGNESRKGIEAPQNYGFTSVVADATKDAQGKIQQCAESFAQFMGGNRSFPVLQNMDDRRHRLSGLEKGDTAMFRQALDKLQFHFSTDGGFLTGPRDKTVRMHLLDEDSGKQSQQGQSGAQQMGASGGSSSSSGQSGSQQMGQQARYKDAQKSYRFVDVTKDQTRVSGNECHSMLSDGNTYVHVNSDKQVYLGAQAGKATFGYVVTTKGPCKNTLGKVG